MTLALCTKGYRSRRTGSSRSTKSSSDSVSFRGQRRAALQGLSGALCLVQHSLPGHGIVLII